MKKEHKESLAGLTELVKHMLSMHIKVCCVVVISLAFSMRFLLGVSRRVEDVREWFKETTPSHVIIDDLRKEKYSADVLNEVDPFGKTGLMQAVARVDLELAKAFVEAGADINQHAADDVGDTALHIACYSGSFPGTIPIIEYFTFYKYPSGAFAAQVSSRNKRGETPLHHAAQIGIVADRQKVMEWLVSRGADINAQDNNGTTVLHIAVNNKDDFGVQMLFDTFGARLNTNIINRKERKNALEYAWYLGFRDIAVRIERCIEELKSKQGRFRK